VMCRRACRWPAPKKLFPDVLRRTVQAIPEGPLCENFPDAWCYPFLSF
jgi:hypothetical protein